MTTEQPFDNPFDRPFDPTHSAAIKRMLMTTVDQTQPSLRKRVALIVSLGIAALLLAGGGTAWALGARIFPAPEPAPTHSHSITPTPTATPTPTVTPTPVVPANTGVPKPTVPVGCSQLVSTHVLAVLMPGGAMPANEAEPYEPLGAAALQAGVLDCGWSFDPGGADAEYLQVSVAPGAPSGLSQIAVGKGEGEASLDVGDASDVVCDGDMCAGDVVTGVYWFQFQFSAAGTTGANGGLATLAGGIVTELQQNPAPGPSWTGPATSWTVASDCDDLLTAAQVSAAADAPGMMLVPVDTDTSVSGRLSNAEVCNWEIQGASVSPATPIVEILVQLAPQAAWAYAQESQPSSALQTGDFGGESGAVATTASPVTVPGADSATEVCEVPRNSGDAPDCWLNVLTDNSWLQFNADGGQSPADLRAVINVAAAMIANHR